MRRPGRDPGVIDKVIDKVIAKAVARTAGTVKTRSSGKPTLIVFLTVDQLRPDYFTRFEHQLTGGLARLYKGGAVFTNAFHDHAITETAPGHSVTMSGRFPVHTGITMNSAGVFDADYKLLDASGGAGASPLRFRGTTLTDWVRAAHPQSRVLSISRKDRGAILPVGRSKAPVFWYGSNGEFTTSTYYADTLPTWLRDFNAQRLPHHFAGRPWDLLLPASEYPEPDSVGAENAGGPAVFPHVVPADTARAVRGVSNLPWMDQITLQAALAGVRAMNLGAGPYTDILAVSLSATDAVGHTYGPDSREIHDQILRLDRYLGAFLDTLFTLRGESRVVVALTSDHGVSPYPEVRSSYDRNENAKRVDLSPVVRTFFDSLSARGASASAFRFTSGVLTVDRAALTRARINADSVVFAFRDAVLNVPGVLRADRIVELQRVDTTADAVARRWLHMFADDSVATLVVTLTPYSNWGKAGAAEHGSPHDYDAHVPVIFYGAPFRAGRYDKPARVADMAPTLAAMLGITPLERTDGRPLTQALR